MSRAQLVSGISLPSIVASARLLGGDARCNQVLCPGPNHSKTDRSLSVRFGEEHPDGFLVNSFAGDDPLACRDHVREKLGIERQSRQPARARKAKSRIVAEYDYRNAAGQLEFQVVRLEPKSFRQRRPNGSGGWTWKVQGVTPLPYRLDEVAVAIEQGQVVVVVEGEKDADNLASIGVCATTCAGGAGKWKPEITPHFKGANIVVIPDNDDPGRDHANKVSSDLAAVATSVRILDLKEHWPACPSKGDISDWLSNGGTRENLDQLLTSARPWSAQAEELKDSGLTQREALLTVCDGAELWRSTEGETFASVTVADHREHYPLNSRSFRDWALSNFASRYRQNKRPASVGETAVREAKLALEARAYSAGRTHKASLRVTEHDGAVYIDRGSADWSAIKVEPTGWSIVNKAPVPIVRSKRTGAFLTPATSGTSATESFAPIWKLLDRLSDTDKILFLAWCVAALWPAGPYPILVVGGEAGSGKSTLSRLAQRIVDPVAGDLLQPPNDDRDLIAAAKCNHVLAFDNLSGLKAEMADSLCRLATGSEIGGRALYSDWDTATSAAQRPIVLNGIPGLAARGDLADRSIMLRLGPLDGRMTERDWWRKVDEALPTALAGLLDALATGLRRLNDVPTPSMRMADFARLVVAAEPALPWRPDAFLEAYESNRSDAVAALVDGDAVANAIRGFALDHCRSTEWKGLVSELHSTLGNIVGLDIKKSGDWPANSRWFSDRLRRAAPALRALGVKFSVKREAAGQTVTIEQLATPATQLHQNGV